MCDASCPPLDGAFEEGRGESRSGACRQGPPSATRMPWREPISGGGDVFIDVLSMHALAPPPISGRLTDGDRLAGALFVPRVPVKQHGSAPFCCGRLQSVTVASRTLQSYTSILRVQFARSAVLGFPMSCVSQFAGRRDCRSAACLAAWCCENLQEFKAASLRSTLSANVRRVACLSGDSLYATARSH